MSPSEWGVLGGAVLGIALVNGYFFRARAAAQASMGTDGVQQVRVVVRGGYQPALIRVRRDRPVRLVFDRQETSSCSEEIVIPDLGVRRFLPAFKETTVEFTPTAAGTHEFTCGMSMLRGKLVVEEE
jgi:plastocyanin domain-containing protein